MPPPWALYMHILLTCLLTYLVNVLKRVLHAWSVVLFVRSNNLITTETIVLTHAEDRFRVVSAETVTSGFLNRPYPAECKVSARWRRAANTTRTNDRRRRRRENPISARTTRATVSGGGLGWSGRGRRQILHGTTQDEDRAGRKGGRTGGRALSLLQPGRRREDATQRWFRLASAGHEAEWDVTASRV